MSRRIQGMAKRLVFFGGSFDPVHNGHLIVTRSVVEQCGLARITLVPAGTPPHKAPPVASAKDRLAMLRAAVRGKPVFDICDVELRRTGPSYTIDTLRELRLAHGRRVELAWVIGADMLEDLHRWRDAEGVLAAARILIAVRPPWDQRIDAILAGLRRHLPAAAVRRLARAVVRTPLVEISSSDIRRRIAAGRAIDFLVPDPVRAYIYRNGLYGTPS